MDANVKAGSCTKWRHTLLASRTTYVDMALLHLEVAPFTLRGGVTLLLGEGICNGVLSMTAVGSSCTDFADWQIEYPIR